MDYNAIQNYYDTEKVSWKHVAAHFSINVNKLWDACEDGVLKSRTRSESITLSAKRNPQKHTQETKDKISKRRKDYLAKNPDKVPYKLNHKHLKESYPETYFKKCFGDAFEIQYRVGLYELDFAHLTNRWDIEIDGSQHRLDSRIIQHDIKRNDNLIKMGWTVIRIAWDIFISSSFEDKQQIVNAMLAGIIPNHPSIVLIAGNENVSQQEFQWQLKQNNKTLCPSCQGVKTKQSMFCRKCRTANTKNYKLLEDNTKVKKIPEKEELEHMVKEQSISNIRKHYKVAARTVWQWIDSYKIVLPYTKGKHMKYYFDKLGYTASPPKKAKTKIVRNCSCGRVITQKAKSCRNCYELSRKKLVGLEGNAPSSIG